jgi:DNA-binding transcriptional LysR family regulator
VDTIDGMRAFVAVANARSFTAGGERIGLSTKLTSKYVRQLEQRLGVPLFNRTTRSVRLTDDGQAYLTRCARLLDEFDEVEAAVQAKQTQPRGKIRLTAPTTFGERDLTRALGDFLRVQPEITIDLEMTDRNVSLIEEGFDLGIRIGSLTDSSLIARKLAPARIVVCAAPDYLDRAGRPSYPQDLADHTCIVDTNIRGVPNWPFLIGGEPVTVRINGRFSANTPRAAAEMAVSGLGIALCPMYAAAPAITAGKLEILFAENEAFDFGIYAIYPHNRHLTARVRVLVDHLAAWAWSS